jgi:voltage-gated potassium channel Kch
MAEPDPPVGRPPGFLHRHPLLGRSVSADSYGLILLLVVLTYLLAVSFPTDAQVLFFSFVTLTTTGYGDLVPATNPGQTMAVLEAVLGQLFLVTAVAKIITAWKPKGWRASDDPGDQS